VTSLHINSICDVAISLGCVSYQRQFVALASDKCRERVAKLVPCGISPDGIVLGILLVHLFGLVNQTEKMDQKDPEDYPIWGYAAWNEFRDPLAAFIGCKRDELALVRNATEGNSYIANGIDMKAGDEVLMTDQEHPGGEQPWQLRAKRYGIVVKKVTLPKPVQNADQVLN